jgi:hypothetical protein
MAHRKPTAADRPEFRRDVEKMMETLDVQVGEIDDPRAEAVVILVTLAVDFDPASNVLWELDANKSAVRPDVHCSFCKGVVAMSNHAYGRYAAMVKKPRVCCTRCVGSLVKT